MGRDWFNHVEIGSECEERYNQFSVFGGLTVNGEESIVGFSQLTKSSLRRTPGSRSTYLDKTSGIVVVY